MSRIQLDGNSLDLSAVVRVARAHEKVSLSDAAEARMQRSRDWVKDAAEGRIQGDDGEPLPIYGVNTGFGSLARVRIDASQSRALSWNLIQSHAAGVGDPAPEDVVRTVMLLRANALSKGASGCRPSLVKTLCAMLDAGIAPEVPSQGSCGSSGDLAPLAHLGLVVFRGDPEDPSAETGWARYQGRRVSGAEAMREAGIERLVASYKDGLAMCNGSQLTTAYAALAWHDAAQLVLGAEIAAAMSWEALRGVTSPLSPEVHALRPYAGSLAVVGDLRKLLEGSELTDSLPGKVQDAYSLRCTPEVLGAVRDGLRFAHGQIAIELNAATDNPLILVDLDGPNKAVSAGLFHGEPVGMASDHMKVCVSELAALSERRLYRLTTGSLSGRLPPALVRKDRPGMGLMVPQTTAAALVSENRSLAWPNSVDSVPTCEDQEDLVAMSTSAARRAYEMTGNSRKVVAIELLAAAHGLWWRKSEEGVTRLGRGTTAALEVVEAALSGSTCASEEIAALERVLVDGSLVAAVHDAVGGLCEVIDG